MRLVCQQQTGNGAGNKALRDQRFCHTESWWPMSNDAIVQYRGFEAQAQVRQYTFNVREAGSDREFTVSIENEAFTSHRARYQDGPSICSIRLNAELLAHANHPPDSHFAITTPELKEFRDTRTPKPSGPFARKPVEDF